MLAIAFLAALCVLLCPITVRAELAVFTNKVGGVYSDPSNWEVGPPPDPQHRVPGAGDIVNVAGDGATLTIDGAFTCNSLLSGPPIGNYVLNVMGSLSAMDMTLPDTVVGEGTLNASKLGTVSLSVVSGTRITAPELTFTSCLLQDGARLTTETSTTVGGVYMTVDGAGSRWDHTGDVPGESHIRIRNGGVMTWGSASETSFADRAFIEVDGGGSSWTCGPAELNQLIVTGGGSARCDSLSFFTERLMISGAGSIATVSGAAYVGGSVPRLVTDGGILITGETIVSNLVSFTVAGGGARWNVNGPLFSSGNLEVGPGGSIAAEDFNVNANLIVSGLDGLVIAAANFNTGAEPALGLSRVTVQKQGLIQSARGFIASNSRHYDSVTITDAGSAWTVSSGLAIGDRGNGTLTLNSGGRVQAADNAAISIALDAGSGGRLFVRDAGSIFDARGAAMSVGTSGIGLLQIESGGRVLAQDFEIGSKTDSNGEVNVLPDTASLEISQDIIVGVDGRGRLNIGNSSAGSAIARAHNVSVGRSLATNLLSVAGPGAELFVARTLTIGDGGRGLLIVTNGGLVLANRLVVSNKTDALGIAKVLMADRAQLACADASLVAPSDPGDPALVVDNSTLRVTNDLTLSRVAALLLRNGGLIEANRILVGSNGCCAHIEVDGARLKAREELSIGVSNGGSGTLKISNQGQVNSKSLLIGNGGVGELTVSGQGTVLDNAGVTSVGRQGRGNFNVEGGALVKISDLVVGESEQTNVVKIADLGSELQVLGDLTVGGEGIGEMFILGGGKLSVNGDGLQIGEKGGSFGLLTIDGSGSTLSIPSAAMQIGVNSTGLLTISRGARVDSQSAQLGVEDLGHAEVIVGQDGAKWNIAGNLEIGLNEIVQLRIDRGGSVQAREALLGRESGGVGILQVGGAGAQLTLQQGLTVGEKGTGLLEVAAGGAAQISGEGFVIGAEPDSSGRVVVGGGPGTVDAGQTTLIIGESGEGTLFVLPQGNLTSGPAQMAVQPEGTALATVSGRTALWRVNGRLAVGVAGEATAFVVAKGRLEVRESVDVGRKGRLCGDGTIKAITVANNGAVCPGSSPGTLIIDGDYIQNPGGRLEIQIGGTMPEVQHDLLQVTGEASLAGKLSLDFINGFAPKKGQSFEFLKLGGVVTGRFDEILISGLTGFQYEVKATAANTYVLTALSDGIATSPPLLSLERAGGGQLVISWPETAVGFTLQSTTSLGGPNWQTRSAVGNRYTTSSAAPVEFFRLVR